MNTKTKERKDVYSRITDKIIAELEKGSRPWTKPWSAEHAAGRISRPLRHDAKTPYQGINVIALWMAATASGYAAPIWMTYRQAKELGGQVHEGIQRLQRRSNRRASSQLLRNVRSRT